jgi:hypothetical protein
MKLGFFDDFKLGVVVGDGVVDVTGVVKDISRLGPQDVMRGVIERFDTLKGKHRGCGRERAGQAGLAGKIPSAAAQVREHHLHGGELHGGRQPVSPTSPMTILLSGMSHMRRVYRHTHGPAPEELGSSSRGIDCYPSKSALKRLGMRPFSA